MKILTAIGSILSFILALYINYLSQTDEWMGKSVDEVSAQYPTLITPASYAFSIWGVIYLSMIGFLIFQFKKALQPQLPQRKMQNIRLAFIVLHLLNAAWVVSWTYEYLLLSFLLISCMLISALYILLQERDSLPSVGSKWWVQYPFEIYTGWLTMATVANAATTIQSFSIVPVMLEGIMALIVLFIAWWIYYQIWAKYHWFAFHLVGIWAFIAIGINQYSSNLVITIAAWASAAFLLSLITPKTLRRE